MNLEQIFDLVQCVITLAALVVLVLMLRQYRLPNQPTYYSAREAVKLAKWCVLFEGVPADDDHPIPTYTTTVTGTLDDVVRQAQRDLGKEANGPWELVDWWEVKARNDEQKGLWW